MPALRRLVLASDSPRRLALLRQVGVEPDLVVSSGIVEAALADETPRQMAARLARAKAQAVDAPGAFVLAADTVVAVGRRVLGKPADDEAALAGLRLLSGRGHRVFSAVVLRHPDGRVAARLSETRVNFCRLNAAALTAYLASGEWRGKAGGYAVQGLAATWVRALSGSHSGVVGLPLFETAQLLRGAGWNIP